MYKKAIIATIAAGLIWGNLLLNYDSGLTPEQIYSGVLAILTALGVYGVKNS